MADIANGRDGGSREGFRRRAPPADRPLPPGNNQNDTEERYEICHKCCGDTGSGYDHAGECRPNRSGEIEFNPV